MVIANQFALQFDAIAPTPLVRLNPNGSPDPTFAPVGIGLSGVDQGGNLFSLSGPANVVRLKATELAAEIGNPQAGTMVMVGAYSALTGLIALDSAIEAMQDSIPSYRSQHIEANERALRAGHEAVTPGLYPAWQEVGV